MDCRTDGLALAAPNSASVKPAAMEADVFVAALMNSLRSRDAPWGSTPESE
jgi:hypothetical protein